MVEAYNKLSAEREIHDKTHAVLEEFVDTDALKANIEDYKDLLVETKDIGDDLKDLLDDTIKNRSKLERQNRLKVTQENPINTSSTYSSYMSDEMKKKVAEREALIKANENNNRINLRGFDRESRSERGKSHG